jgi:hypothetical protein
VYCASQVILIPQLIAAPPSLPRSRAALHASLTLLLFTTTAAAATARNVLIGDPCQRLEPRKARGAIGVSMGCGWCSARARAVGRRVEGAAHDSVSWQASDVYAMDSDQIRSDQSTKQVRRCLVLVCMLAATRADVGVQSAARG